MECPVCNCSETEIVYEDPNAVFANIEASMSSFVVELCHNCGLVFQSSAYSEEYDHSTAKAYASYNCSEIFSFPDRSPRNSEALGVITENLPRKQDLNILEIGSNRGDLLFLLKEKIPSANILGVEPTRFSNLSVPTVNASFRKELFASRFDVVIMKHSLEHIKYPQNVIADVREVLSDDGVLYIEVPDLDNSLENRVEDFVPDHVTYFSLHSLNNLLSGFRIISSDTKTFLRVVAVKASKMKEELASIDLNTIHQYRRLFNNFKKHKLQIKERIRLYAGQNKKIVFFGVSYYFSRVFKGLQKGLDLGNCYYYDDNFHEDVEGRYHLPRLDDFDENCVVIICSNNFRVQDAVEQRLLINNDKITVIRPWLKVVEKL